MKFYRLSGAKFYDCINTIYQFIKPFLDNKISIFEECGVFTEVKIRKYLCTEFKCVLSKDSDQPAG